MKKGVLTNFAKFIAKHLCQGLDHSLHRSQLNVKKKGVSDFAKDYKRSESLDKRLFDKPWFFAIAFSDMTVAMRVVCVFNYL